MKDFLIKNAEKVLLTVLLLSLAGSSVFQILTMEKKEIDVLAGNKRKSLVEAKKIKSIADFAISLDSSVARPYDPTGYIYCRKSDCDYLIMATEDKCPWCKTETKPPVVVEKGGDADEDGIPDEVEIKFGLDKDNPADAFSDKDEDGFRNIDEFKMGFSMGDAEDHPSVIQRASYATRRSTYFPMVVSTIDTGKYSGSGDDLLKSTWNIYADIYVKGKKRSRFYRINDHDKDIDYTVADVGVEDGKPFVIFQKGDEPGIKFFANKRPKVDSTYYVFKNMVTRKFAKAYLGQEFFLVDKKGVKEKYKLKSFDASKKIAIVIDYKESDDGVTVGVEPALEDPVDETQLDRGLEGPGLPELD